MEKIKAWHFCDGWQLRDGQQLEVGKTYVHAGPLKLFHSGLHACRRAIDALAYSPGNTICRVECWGDIQEESDKLICSHRKVLAAADAEKTLHAFGCLTATAALLIADVEDQRCFDAIDTKWGWMEGLATDTQLAAAWAAASAAAWVAAMDAARVAAWDAARDEENRLLEEMLNELLD